MTIPQNVKDAVRSIDDSETVAATPHPDCNALVKIISVDDWQTIRAHLLSQEAEIERLRSVHRWNIEKSGGNLMVCRDNHNKGEACEWEIFVPVGRAEKSESRLAAANALLRDIRDWDVAQALGPTREKTLFALPIKLRSRLAKHLQGAGDEA